jgi:flagellar motor protein MotB
MKLHTPGLLLIFALAAASVPAQVEGPPRKPVTSRPPAPGVAPFRSPAPAGVGIKPPAFVTPVPRPALPAAPSKPVARPAKPVVPISPARIPPGVVIRPAIVNPPGPVGGPGASVWHNARTIRGPLSIPPRRVPPAVVVPGVTVIREVVPVEFGRFYDSERSVLVVSAEDGQKTELPYSAVPLLFAAGTTRLLDQSAVDILESLGSTLLEIYKQDKNVRFAIEGHTSTDHEAPDALDLSTQRASRIHAELVSRYRVPAAILTFKGYGETYADYRDGTEEQMQLDRRVLVVRTQ